MEHNNNNSNNDDNNNISAGNGNSNKMVVGPTTHGGFWAMPRADFGQIWSFSGQDIVMPGEASAARVGNYLPMPMSQGHLNLLASFSAGPARGGGGGADDENC